MRRKRIAGLAVFAAAAVLAAAGPPILEPVFADDGPRHDGDHGPPPTHGRPGAAEGLGQLTGLLPRENLTLSSVIQVDLEQGDRAPAAVQGQGQWPDRLVRIAGCVR